MEDTAQPSWKKTENLIFLPDLLLPGLETSRLVPKLVPKTKPDSLLSVYGCSYEGSQNITPFLSPYLPLSTGPLHFMGYVFRI